MPQKSKVSVDDAVTVLIKYMSYFASSELPGWSSVVWGKMANESQFKDKWSTECVRTNVKNNRRNILTLAREQCNYFEPVSKKNIDYDGDEDSSDDDDDNEKDPDYFATVYDEERENFDIFNVTISRDLWNSVKKTVPIARNDKKNPGFQPKIWTDTIAFEFWKQYRLKCAFVFKKGSIHQHGYYFATIIGRCKSKKCRNILFGYIEKDPGDVGDVILKINCKDTRFEKHDECYRPFAGERRQAIKQLVKHKEVKSIVNEEVRKLYKPGDTQCPVMYKSNILYKLKRENIKDEYGIKAEDRRDPIKALMCIDETPMYRDSIHLVGCVPFWVFYATPSQIHCYSEYRRLHRETSSICIDATGGVVRKFLDCKNERTSTIFLYQIVINFYRSSVSVYQMLSEAHDADIIELWLNKWIRLGVLLPHEVVCDGSLALLNGVSLAFNKRSLSDYMGLCFENVKNSASTKPRTYIRLDTAHFIHTVSTWKAWKSVVHKNVKSFYLYCIGLLMECQQWKHFENMFLLILIVSGAEYEDSVINYNGEYITPLDARTKLENLIGNKKTKTFINDIEIKIQSMTFDSEKITLLNDSENDLIDNTTIKSWATELITRSKNVTKVGKTLNCFYVQSIEKPVIKIIREFPLWSKVCIPNKNLRATSSYVEEDFKDLKETLNKEIGLPARVDLFVKAHLKSLLGGITVLQSKLIKFVDDNIDKSTISVDISDRPDVESQKNGLNTNSPTSEFVVEYNSCDTDLKIEENNFADEVNENSSSNTELEEDLCNENWRGLGNDPKHKKIDWLNYDNKFNYENKDNFDNGPQLSTVEEDFTLSDEITNNVVMSNNFIECIKNEHDYSLKTSTPLMSQDNKKNVLNAAVEKIGRKIQNEGKYFKDCPEIPLLNNLIKSVKGKKDPEKTKKNKKVENCLLINGNKSGPIHYNGGFFLVFNTCPLDSIIQLLFNAGLEDQNFRQYLNGSKNQTFTLVTNLLKHGLQDTIYEERFSILHKIYGDKEIKSEKNKEWIDKETQKAVIISRVYNCEDNVTILWNRLFEFEPSMFENFSCRSRNCISFQLNKAAITVNYKTLIENGMKDLENAIVYQGMFQRLCTGCKKKTQTCEQQLNKYIYIELDVKLGHQIESMTCKLCDFPNYLNIAQNRRYRSV